MKYLRTCLTRKNDLGSRIKYACQKLTCPSLFRPREDLLWRALLDDVSMIEKQDSIGNLAREVHLMRDEEPRHVRFMSQLAKDTQDFIHEFRVQC